MILVDIYVPSVDKAYDFSLDENAKGSVILEEIVEMIDQKERTSLVGDLGALMLCDRLNCRVLPMDTVLKDCGLHNGSSLLLV